MRAKKVPPPQTKIFYFSVLVCILSLKVYTDYTG